MLPHANIGVLCDYSTEKPFLDDEGEMRIARPLHGEGEVAWVTMFGFTRLLIE